MENQSTDTKDTFFALFELVRDLFAAIGSVAVIVATIFYSWGYFS